MTTGAFYGYFSSKEALFASIVEPHAAALMGRFMEAQTTFAELPETEQPAHMGKESGAYVHWMVDYICEHREPVKLLLCRAEGTSYEHFVHNMVEVEVESHPPIYGGAAPRWGRMFRQLDRIPVPYHCQRHVQRAFLRWWSTICRSEQATAGCGAVPGSFYTGGWLRIDGDK